VDEDSSEITTFKEFSARLIQSGLRRITYKHVTGVPVASVDIFDFAMSIETRLKLFLL
jgi:hypothetical protein